MISVIMRKELKIYFYSPIAYIIITFFLLILSYLFFFFQQFFANNIATLRGYFGVIPLVYVLLVPAITMRSWAEEFRQGTYELLVTMPYRETQLVVGKFLGALLLLCIMLILTLPVPLLLIPFGHFEIGEIAGEYIGVLLLGAASISIGQLISSTSRNQISAFLSTVFVLLAFTLIGGIPRIVSLPLWLADLIRYFSFNLHYQSLLKGLIDTRDAIFYLLVTALALYGTTQVLLTRKRRG